MEHERPRPATQRPRVLTVGQPPCLRALDPVASPHGVGRQGGKRADGGDAERLQMRQRPLVQWQPLDGLLGQVVPVGAGNDGDGCDARRAGRHLRRQASRRQSDMGRLAGFRRDIAAHPRAQRRVGAIERIQSGRVGKRQSHPGVLHQRGEAIQHVEDRRESAGVTRWIVGDVDAVRAALGRFLDRHSRAQSRAVGGVGNLDQPPLVSLRRVDRQWLRRPRWVRLRFHRGAEARHPEAERLAIHRTS